MNLQAYKAHFDTALESWLESKLESVRGYFPDDETFDLLTYLRPYVDHGKRFRPYMVYLRYSLYGWEDVEYITQVGIVSEMIHIFALIHDDICDQGTMRHQIPTYHQHLATTYDDTHIWLSQAMLVWDLVYTRALQEACTVLTGTHAHQIVMDMLNEVVIGQMLDIDYSHTQQLKIPEQIATKDHLKSGQYTFQKPMMIGASLAGMTDLDAVQDLWRKIGVAFQMRDDLLDWIPNSEWKTKMSDIQEWNQTVVMQACHEHFSEADFQTLRSARGTKLDEQSMQRLQTLFEAYHIQEHVQTQIGTLLDEVEQDFAEMWLDTGYVEHFQQVIGMLRSV